jgi:2-amino-4-hydroxy-6-hydroxymethyldihydropteridine diphosphokinase
METDQLYVGLGSNLGNRRENLALARSRIEDGHADLLDGSSVLETEPVGVDTERMFLNQVIRLHVTRKTPVEMLETLLSIESDIGRDRARAPDRVIDLDMLYWDDLVREEDPVLPHPEIHHRRFVLEGMVELSPEFRHPRLGKTQEALLAQLTGE